MAERQRHIVTVYPTGSENFTPQNYSFLYSQATNFSQSSGRPCVIHPAPEKYHKSLARIKLVMPESQLAIDLAKTLIKQGVTNLELTSEAVPWN